MENLGMKNLTDSQLIEAIDLTYGEISEWAVEPQIEAMPWYLPGNEVSGGTIYGTSMALKLLIDELRRRITTQQESPR